jgi:hypothetical protein
LKAALKLVVVPENGRGLRRTWRVKLVLNIFVVREKRLEASADFERRGEEAAGRRRRWWRRRRRGGRRKGFEEPLVAFNKIVEE